MAKWNGVQNRAAIESLEPRYALDASGLPITIDDGDVGFDNSRWIVTGGYGYGGDARIGFGNFSGDATWHFEGLDPGTYRILGTWKEHSNRATDAVFSAASGDLHLHHGLLNQRNRPSDVEVDGFSWEELAVVQVTDGDLLLTLRPGTDGLTIADAMRLEAIDIDPAVLTTVRSGPWSDPATWGGRLPTASDDVLIQHAVVADAGSARIIEVSDSGELRLQGVLNAYGSVVVHGALTGTEGTINFHVEDDRRFVGNVTPGPDHHLPDFHVEDVGLWGMPGSTIDLAGEYVTPWLNAVASEPGISLGYGITSARAIADGQANLDAAPTGWRSGDALLLVNEKGDHQLATLEEVQGSQIRYRIADEGAGDDFVANLLTVDGRSIQPKVANLSRRLQIVSADVVEGDSNHRAHTLFFAGSTANLTNIELRNLGPREKLGRYPVHFHHGGAIESSLEGTSIWQDVSEAGNRFVALHGVQGVRVANNVGFASQGHGFFMEDGREYGNEIIGNLSVAVEGPEVLPHADSDVAGSHHFWLRAGNTISGNVAAGNDAIGLVILSSKASDQSTVVSGQEALGSKKYGIWTFAPDVVFSDSKVAFAEQAGIAVDAKWGRDSSGTRINDPMLVLNGLNSPTYESQLYLNQARDVYLEGGVIAGGKGFHTHYSSSLRVVGSRINVGTFLTPTYWESEVIATNVELDAVRGFDRAYPIRAYAPGLVQITDSTFRMGVVQSDGVSDAYFTSASYRYYPSFSGTSVENAWMLDAAPPRAGFVVLPENTRSWKVAPVGQDFVVARTFYWRNSLQEWSASATGYPHGLPPGEYQMEAFDASGQSLGQDIVTVFSGRASELNVAN